MSSTSITSTANSDLFSERLHRYLKNNQDKCDVTFSVGPNKILVKAARLILVAACPEFQRLFEEKWDQAVVKEGEGIPLPDFDPDAFEIFLKLLPSEHITEKALTKLCLTANQIFDLIYISRTLRMKRIQSVLEIIIEPFYEDFVTYAKTPNFLSLSLKTLRTVLSSDWIYMEEVDVFKLACKWAEHQCTSQSLELTIENMRNVLADVFFEIRFPLMRMRDFSKTVFPKQILTADEKLELFEYFALEGTEKTSFDAFKSGFKVQPRTIVSPDVSMHSKVRLFRDSQICDSAPAICDGAEMYDNRIRVGKKYELIGLGFLGPLDGDCTYEVGVEPYLFIDEDWESNGWTKKRVRAKHGRVFYFLFDEPIVVHPQKNRKNYGLSIHYSLKGPPTQSVDLGSENKELNAEEYGFKLHCLWRNKQIAEILFNKL